MFYIFKIIDFLNIIYCCPKTDIETKCILKECIAARAALATLKEAAKLIPNQQS